MTGKEIEDLVYEFPSAKDQIRAEAEGYFRINNIHILEGGMLIYSDGMEYPERGSAPQDVMVAVNIAKRMFIEILKIFATPSIIPSAILFALIPYKAKVSYITRALKSYNRLSMGVMSEYILKIQYMNPLGRELLRLIDSFLKHIGIDKETSYSFAKVFSHLIDYDNAYRYRVQDLFNETTQARLYLSPIREVLRLIRINRERESQHKTMVSHKFKLVGLAVTLALLHPKIRKAFKIAVMDINYANLKPDEYDRFWMCIRPDYSYFGKTNTERRQMVGHLRVAKPRKRI